MLSYETERRLKNFLVAVTEGEIQLESMRQRLCQICDFAPCTGFQRIDRGANERISSYDILNFLREHCIHSASENDCHRLVKFFDSDEDGRLNYNE